MPALSSPHPHPSDVVATYDAVAHTWDKHRSRKLFERGWLDRWLGLAPRERPLSVLDLGCGSGRPIARYVSDRGAEITGIDAAPAMIALFRANLPWADAHVAQMQTLDLDTRFSAILAWNSFFHLSAEDQRAMFGVFARHAKPGAALMFTSGHREGEAEGLAGGQPIYHASLSPEAYRQHLNDAGFKVVSFTPEDPTCQEHSVWLARYAPTGG